MMLRTGRVRKVQSNNQILTETRVHGQGSANDEKADLGAKRKWAGIKHD